MGGCISCRKKNDKEKTTSVKELDNEAGVIDITKKDDEKQVIECYKPNDVIEGDKRKEKEKEIENNAAPAGWSQTEELKDRRGNYRVDDAAHSPPRDRAMERDSWFP